jgi:hypothetical protein
MLKKIPLSGFMMYYENDLLCKECGWASDERYEA